MRFESSNVQLAAAEKLQKEASTAYRKGNFKLAADKFTEAINMKPPILMSLLDGRAATYERLGELKSALTDAKTMIKLEVANPKGYLRAGRVLVRMDKLDVSIDIYKSGLKHVSASDPNIGLLKGVLEKATEKKDQLLKASVKNKYDPMQVLPLELLEMIMEYVPFHNVVTMQRVSKTWKTVISNNSRFWTLLDFSRVKRPVQRGTLSAYIRNSKNTVNKAVLNKIQGFQDETLINMVSVCKELEYLKLMDGMFGASLTRAMALTTSLKTLILHCLIPITTLETLIIPDLNLEHLECLHLGPSTGGVVDLKTRAVCPSFKRVLFNFAEPEVKRADRTVALNRLAEILPNVQELQLNKLFFQGEKLDLTPLEKLEVFVCRNSKISVEEILYPLSLRILDLACTSIADRDTNTAENQETLPNLERLNLTKTDISSRSLCDLVPPLENVLTHLRLGWCKHIGFELIHNLYLANNSFQTLVELSVEGNYEFSNKSIQSLFYLPKLSKLDASSTSMNGSGAFQLMQKSSSSDLEEIIMNGVERISEQLLAEARGRGIRIVQHMENSRAWQLLQGENLSPFMRH